MKACARHVSVFHIAKGLRAPIALAESAIVALDERFVFFLRAGSDVGIFVVHRVAAQGA